MASKFEIDRSQYFPDVARSVTFPTVREARAEYSRLRKIAAKRLQRLSAAGYSNMATYQRYANSFSPLPKDLSESRVYKKLNEVAHFLSLKSSTVSGEREKIGSTIERLHELGYDFVDESNIREFGQFMDTIRSYVGGKDQDYSEQAIEVFRQNLDAEDPLDPQKLADQFADWLLGEDEEAPVFDEADQHQEPIPGEREPVRRTNTRRKQTPAQKRAERNKQRADQTRREKQRKSRRK